MSIGENQWTRREAIGHTALAALALPMMGPVSLMAQNRSERGSYEVPTLPYALDALEPYISAKIMELHYTKHHRGYVHKLNQVAANIEQQPIEKLLQNIDSLPQKLQTPVRNFGGGHYNHTLYWYSMTPTTTGQPGGALGEAIVAKYGTFDEFIKNFRKAALTLFGSGWAWLSLDKHQEMVLEITRNQDNPIMFGRTPLLGVDVWEHAYYLQYHNRRDRYVDAFLNVVNWNRVAQRYQAASGKQ